MPSPLSQLFADITHELGTPLTSICGYAETLLDPGVSVSDEKRARYVRGVLEESRRLGARARDRAGDRRAARWHGRRRDP